MYTDISKSENVHQYIKINCQKHTFDVLHLHRIFRPTSPPINTRTTLTMTTQCTVALESATVATIFAKMVR